MGPFAFISGLPAAYFILRLSVLAYVNLYPMQEPSTSLKIYKSSAGSGKTYTLVKEYLRICLPRPERFRNTVAITFTNAAAAEMKDRILLRLEELADGQSGPLAKQLLEEGLMVKDLNNASRLLQRILYNYSFFNVSTIDSFFHKILRTFNKELELPMDFDINLETKEALDYAVDNFLYKSVTMPETQKMMVAFVREKINSGSSWQLRADLEKITNELVKDASFNLPKVDYEQIEHFIKSLNTLKYEFESGMDEIGRKAQDAIARAGLGLEDFKYGKTGPANYFNKIRKGIKEYEPTKRFTSAIENEAEWVKDKSLMQGIASGLVESTLMQLAEEALSKYADEYPTYVSAKEVLKHIYTFAVYEEINKVLQEYREKNNIVLVSDFTRILARYVMHEDMNFVFSKLGARLEHFLIDEFQDTSRLQWAVLKPLMENAVALGSDCLVVGDAKQAIYRWRGGEVELLETHIRNRDFPGFSTELDLNKNFRSRDQIIHFNNSFFARISALYPGEEYEYKLLSGIFDKASQEKASLSKDEGYVELRFLTKEGRRRELFCEKARDITISTINKCLQDGYSLKDITILVRNKNDTTDIARLLASNKIAFITQDSLFLDQSPAVQLLLSLLQYIEVPYDALARTELLSLYSTYFMAGNVEKPSNISILSDFQRDADTLFAQLLPQAFTQNLQALAVLPVYELVEELIRIFDLASMPDAYIQRFQDVVFEYTNKSNYGIIGFLESWKAKHFTVVIPEDQDAIRIMTIHKSKGLEFPVVIMPYTDWDFQSGKPDLIWVSSNAVPFNEMPVLPLSAGNRLKTSVFSSDYQREEAFTAIDNLNLLYVAFTRAQNRLYICTQQAPDAEQANIKSVSALLNLVMEPSDKENDFVIRYGQENPYKAEEEKGQQNQELEMEEYTVNNWRELIYNTQMDLSQGLKDTATSQTALNNKVEKLLIENNLSEFCGQKSNLGSPALCIPKIGLYRPDRYIESDNAISILKIALNEDASNEWDKLSQYKDFIQNTSIKLVKAVLLDLKHEAIIV